MEPASPSVRNLARGLLAVEASQPAGDLRVPVAVRVCEKLRVSLTRVAGADGFTALLRRALVLARADVPALQSVKVNARGSLEGLEEVVADAGNGGSDAAVAIIVRLLELLITFIGAPLTVRLVGDAWPDALLDE
jgi:hypothetical protein